eukprot:scaffold20709_cov59-Phaeocystis_antarctica.AAC.4
MWRRMHWASRVGWGWGWGGASGGLGAGGDAEPCTCPFFSPILTFLFRENVESSPIARHLARSPSLIIRPAFIFIVHDKFMPGYRNSSGRLPCKTEEPRAHGLQRKRDARANIRVRLTVSDRQTNPDMLLPCGRCGGGCTRRVASADCASGGLGAGGLVPGRAPVR